MTTKNICPITASEINRANANKITASIKNNFPQGIAQPALRALDEYLASVAEDKRAALEKLRQQIKGIVPQAEEGIYYHLPAFRLSGKWLVAFGAARNHCSFYPLSAAVINAHQDELKKYETSKGTIRYDAAQPLPLTLVRKIVQARIFENELKRKRAK